MPRKPKKTPLSIEWHEVGRTPVPHSIYVGKCQAGGYYITLKYRIHENRKTPTGEEDRIRECDDKVLYSHDHPQINFPAMIAHDALHELEGIFLRIQAKKAG